MGLLGALVILIAALWPVPALLVQDLDGPEVMGIFPVGPGQTLHLRYRHSLYGGRVWEHFRIGREGLVLVAVEAEREAALEYYGLPRRIRYRTGGGIVEGLKLPVGELVVRATSLGERTLVVGGRAIPLAAGREGHRIRLRVVSLPAVRLVWNRLRDYGKGR
ncbi:MAG: DUF1850 domain-containing protein [Armatimonadota bacterium]|nr:DUF1850 domain-containing protein [Armatimonadota bacterium]MDR7444307.1 DUF1850 domain-containing protein [Armatimonadota bacterium]MDR7569702.1 DUF1850 domain-containing protein [Armatimonadota bacterium]MDR7614794.1 DUF1850 domain-containing protein [Armatimonadota bacterium]